MDKVLISLNFQGNNVNGHDAMQMKPPREHTQSGPPRALQQRQASIKDKDPVAATAVHQDDTMGQLKRTFAGIFGDV